MPINPERNWRPQHDLGRSYGQLTTDQSYEGDQPITQQSAIDRVRDMALDEIVCYDGHECQGDMIAQKAAELYPLLFGLTIGDKPLNKPADNDQNGSSIINSASGEQQIVLDKVTPETTTYVPYITQSPPKPLMHHPSSSSIY
ncbi:MAG TPA: hypothetical protein VNE40_01255 [Candidatus Dormibacteraeota bacterium]|nr:hypothetical protein [Candidatus Dormibacteraeota bacterium]